MSLKDTLSAALPVIDSRSISQVEQEIVDELDFHIAMRMEENMSQGMSPDVARSAALTQFGDLAVVQQQCRRALLGARIMWQRIQLALLFVLMAAVVVLALQMYAGQQANQAAIADITTALKQIGQPPAGAELLANNQQPASADAAEEADENGTYPITLSAKKVVEFDSLSVQFANLKLEGKSITAVPISTEVGITGAVLIGTGTYEYKPAADKSFKGTFHTAMLRFNPKDANSIIKLGDGKSVTDKGAQALARSILATTFGHCYHSGSDALIPAKGALAADVMSRELGDVLFSSDGDTAIAYNFTDRKALYEKK